MLDKLDKRTADRIIRSLADSGQPPKLGALYLNVGTDKMLQRLRTEYLEDHLQPFEGQDGGGVCRWVEAAYGNGKTQFLRCVQEQAWHLNFATAFVELSQDECPLDHPERVYGAVAKAVQAPPQKPGDIDHGRGIDMMLQQLLDRRFPGVLTGLPDDALRDEALAWVETHLANTPVDSGAFRIAASRHLAAKLKGNAAAVEKSALFLRGEPIPAAELKDLGVYEKLDKSTGFRMLRSMCQLVQRSGLAAGTVLLFDEARRSLSLMSSKAQKVACENLLTVINRCNSGDLPGTMFLYAVMPEFFTDFATAYPALQQRCGPSTRFNLEAIDGVKEQELLRQIGERIEAVFRIAHEAFPAADPVLLKNRTAVVTGTLQETMVGSGVRRLFVKTWVRALQEFRENGVRPFAEDDVARLIAGASDELRQEEAQDVAQHGE